MNSDSVSTRVGCVNHFHGSFHWSFSGLVSKLYKTRINVTEITVLHMFKPHCFGEIENYVAFNFRAFHNISFAKSHFIWISCVENVFESKVNIYVSYWRVSKITSKYRKRSAVETRQQKLFLSKDKEGGCQSIPFIHALHPRLLNTRSIVRFFKISWAILNDGIQWNNDTEFGNKTWINSHRWIADRLAAQQKKKKLFH